MYPHTVTKTLPSGPIHGVDPPTNYTLVRKRSVAETCIISKFSKWLWSAWVAGGPESTDSLRGLPSTSRSGEANGAIIEPTKQIPGIVATLDESNGLRAEDDLLRDLPCRACKAWGVSCDMQKPRCSHCLDQQLLCFYVAPLRLSMKRSKKARASRTESITSSPPQD